MGFTDSYVNSDGEAVISASGIINDGDYKTLDETKMQETVGVSQKGKSDLLNVGTAMKSINESVIKLKHAIDNVGRASEEITNITGVIGSIADQTNLLSLNASLEAARLRQENMYMLVLANRRTRGVKKR